MLQQSEKIKWVVDCTFSLHYRLVILMYRCRAVVSLHTQVWMTVWETLVEKCPVNRVNECHIFHFWIISYIWKTYYIFGYLLCSFCSLVWKFRGVSSGHRALKQKCQSPCCLFEASNTDQIYQSTTRRTNTSFHTKMWTTTMLCLWLLLFFLQNNLTLYLSKHQNGWKRHITVSFWGLVVTFFISPSLFMWLLLFSAFSAQKNATSQNLILLCDQQE